MKLLLRPVPPQPSPPPPLGDSPEPQGASFTANSRCTRVNGSQAYSPRSVLKYVEWWVACVLPKPRKKHTNLLNLLSLTLSALRGDKMAAYSVASTSRDARYSDEKTDSRGFVLEKDKNKQINK